MRDSLWVSHTLNLSSETLGAIEAFRSEFDPNAVNHRAHITFVFPQFDLMLNEDEYISHVMGVVGTFDPFSVIFSDLHTTLDPISQKWYLFMTPTSESDGFIKVVELHDQLYTGPLSRILRDDIPFIPHVTIGIASDEDTIKMYREHALNLPTAEVFIDKIEVARLSKEGNVPLVVIDLKDIKEFL